MQAASEEVRHEEVEEDDEEGLEDYTGPKPWQRFFLGYRERFVEDCVLELQGGRVKVRLAQAPSARAAAKKAAGGKDLDRASDPAVTGTTVWDGAVVLSHYLTETDALAAHAAQLAAEDAAAAAAAAAAQGAAQDGSAAQAGQEAAAATGDGQVQGTPQDSGATAALAEAVGALGALSLHAAGPQQHPQRHQPISSPNSQQQGQAQQGQGQQQWLPHVLELGAGTGAVGLALLATRRAASATITDLPDLLPHLRLNVQRNAGAIMAARAHVEPLHWGPAGQADIDRLAALGTAAASGPAGGAPAQSSPAAGGPGALLRAGGVPTSPGLQGPGVRVGGAPGALLPLAGPVRGGPPYDLIVGSDLIYYSYTPDTPHSELLLWSLRRLAGPRSLVLLALSLHHNEPEVRSFLRRAARRGFAVARVPRTELPPDMRVPDVMVVRLRWLPGDWPERDEGDEAAAALGLRLAGSAGGE